MKDFENPKGKSRKFGDKKRSKKKDRISSNFDDEKRQSRMPKMQKPKNVNWRDMLLEEEDELTEEEYLSDDQ